MWRLRATCYEEITCATFRTNYWYWKFKYCTHEEADTHIVLHAKVGRDNLYKLLMVQSVDTDVLVWLVRFFVQFECQEIVDFFWSWIHGVRIHCIAAKLSTSKYKVLSMFHAFLGSDSTSSLQRLAVLEIGIYGIFILKYNHWWPEQPNVTKTLTRTFLLSSKDL